MFDFCFFKNCWLCLTSGDLRAGAQAASRGIEHGMQETGLLLRNPSEMSETQGLKLNGEPGTGWNLDI